MPYDLEQLLNRNEKTLLFQFGTVYALLTATWNRR